MTQIAHDFRNAGLAPKDLALLEYAEKITLNADRVTEHDIAALREVGWTDVEILNIAAVTCYRVFISKMADALGVEFTQDYRALDQAYVNSLMVGKKLSL